MEKRRRTVKGTPTLRRWRSVVAQSREPGSSTALRSRRSDGTLAGREAGSRQGNIFRHPSRRDIRCAPPPLQHGQTRGNLEPELELRFLRLKDKTLEKTYEVAFTQSRNLKDRFEAEEGKHKKTIRRVSWADQKGDALTSYPPDKDELHTIHRGPVITPPDQGKPLIRRSRVDTFNQRCDGSASSRTEAPTRFTYKDALLRSASYQPRLAPQFKRNHPKFQPSSPCLSSFEGRCFRCLARDHKVRDCRDPLRCYVCYRIGHPARYCRERAASNRRRMERALRFRPQSMKIFVPLTEGFHARQATCRNAVLANVIGPANLGHCPQETIANDFAARYGGLSDDFHVARHRERDFVIFLPQWVRLADLVSREVIRYPHCQLRFYEWNPYRHATRSRIRYKAWIKLVSLPFECWSEYKVAAVVNGFGRYLHCDDNSPNMLDLTGYRCEIAVEDISDVPKNLAITLGDLVVPVSVQVERTAPFGGDDRGIPFAGGDPNEGGDQTDPLGRHIARRVNHQDRDAANNNSTNGDDTGRSDTWNSSELRDRWQNSTDDRRNFPKPETKTTAKKENSYYPRGHTSKKYAPEKVLDREVDDGLRSAGGIGSSVKDGVGNFSNWVPLVGISKVAQLSKPGGEEPVKRKVDGVENGACEESGRCLGFRNLTAGVGNRADGLVLQKSLLEDDEEGVRLKWVHSCWARPDPNHLIWRWTVITHEAGAVGLVVRAVAFRAQLDKAKHLRSWTEPNLKTWELLIHLPSNYPARVLPAQDMISLATLRSEPTSLVDGEEHHGGSHSPEMFVQGKDSMDNEDDGCSLRTEDRGGILPAAQTYGFKTLDFNGSPPDEEITVETTDKHLSLRKSARLAGYSNDSIFNRARARKAVLREGAFRDSPARLSKAARTANGGTETEPNGPSTSGCSRIQYKSSLCGINLSDDEARCFNDFLRA